jgi:hypothetical protein
LIFLGNAFPEIVFLPKSINCPQVSILEITIPTQLPNGDAIVVRYRLTFQFEL